MSKRRGFIAVAAILLFAVAHAHAHRINILALPEGTLINGYVYYADGAPASGLPVHVRDVSGNSVTTLETDGEGRFTYQPDDSDTLVFVVETADGHRAETAVDFDSMKSDSVNGVFQSAVPTAGLGSEDIQRIVQHEIAPLRIQLDAYERQTRFRDILGGIGYIVGVTGLWAWWKSRHGDRKE